LKGYVYNGTHCIAPFLCPNRTYVDVEKEKCVSCPDNCSLCISKTNCTLCERNYVLYYGKCIPNLCPDSSYVHHLDNNIIECLNCTSHCSNCSNATYCGTCEDTYWIYDGECYDSCPDDSFNNNSNTS